nr:MAG TPA: hypothetical protein [Caudoviricetes sp.]
MSFFILLRCCISFYNPPNEIYFKHFQKTLAFFYR